MTETRLCGLTPQEISGLTGSGENSIRHALAAAHSVYKRGIADIRDFPHLPKSVIQELISHSVTGLFPPVSSVKSSDGSVKYLFRNKEGLSFETVFIPGGRRRTVCVSTQAGCRMGCPFCVTARYGFHGNLSAGDIINQVIAIPEAKEITHIVLMGMGEPLDNLGNVLRSCSILTAEWGPSISCRNITVSTVGIKAGVKKFLEESDCNLTLSLHSPFPDERASIIPAERKNPFREIVTMMKNSPRVKKRRFSIAYMMLSGVNDTLLHLGELRRLIEGTGIRVNLLPYHPVPGDLLSPSSPERIRHFRQELLSSGISASVRTSRGADISAACGLLATGLT